jgi:hypothetical protein
VNRGCQREAPKDFVKRLALATEESRANREKNQRALSFYTCVPVEVNKEREGPAVLLGRPAALVA